MPEGAPVSRREPASLPKASDVLAERLRRHIFSEGLQPGDRLPPEAELIETERLSRASVREALRILETEQLVRIRRGPKGGVFVRYPDPTHVAKSLASLLTLSEAPLRDVFDFRAAVEPAAAAAAAREARPDQVEALQHLANLATVDAEVQFHLNLAGATNNSVFDVLLGSLVEVIREHAPREQHLGAADREDAHRAHQRIADAIASRDEAKAAETTARHIAAFRLRMEKLGRLDEPIVPRERWGQ